MKTVTKALWLSALMMSATLGGCNLNEDTEANIQKPAPADWSANSGKPVAEKPAPAPVPAPAPAPKPMPASPCDSIAYPTGDRATSTMLLERCMPKEVVAGQEFCYTYIVTNLTNLSLSGVTLRDDLSNTFVVSSTSPQAQVAGGTLTWNLGNFGARERREVKVCGKATGAGRITSCAILSWNSVLCAEANVVQPALAVKIELPAEKLICDQICGKITVTNTGTGAASNAKVMYTLPAGWTTTDGKNAVALDAGTLPAGQSRSFDVCAKASKTGTFSGQASAAADGGLSASSNVAQTVVRQPILAVSLACPGTVFIGRNLEYKATVVNSGDGASTNTMLTVNVPGGTTASGISDGGTAGAGTVNWNLGTLNAGQSKTVTFSLNAGGGTGNFAVSAATNGTCATPANANCTSAVVGIPAQLLDGVDEPDPVQVGQTTTYTLYVTNQGSQPLTNIKLNSKMIDGDKMELVSSNGPTGAGAVSGTSITFPVVAKLDPKQRLTYTVVVRAKGEGQVSFETETSSDQVTRPLVKRETTTFYK